MKIQIPDLLRIKPADQDSRQAKDITIDLGINSFLRLVFGNSAVAATVPGYRSLSSLLQNPYAEKSVIRFRQDIFNEIFVRSLEDKLDNIASKLAFCSSDIRRYPNESFSQYLLKEENELRERIEEFKTAIESLDYILKNTESEGLQELYRLAGDIMNSAEYQEIDQRFREYIQASRKYNSPFASWIFFRHVKSRYEAALKEKEERFTFLRERLKLKDLEEQLKAYTIIVSFFRKLNKNGISVCLPEILESSQRSSRIVGAVNPILAVVKGDKVVPNDAYYYPSKNIYVITGPNNGGKTTFARTVGLLCSWLMQDFMLLQPPPR